MASRRPHRQGPPATRGTTIRIGFVRDEEVVDAEQRTTERPRCPRACPGPGGVYSWAYSRLVAQALGVLRTEGNAHLAIDLSLHYAVRTDGTRTLLSDHHRTHPGVGPRPQAGVEEQARPTAPDRPQRIAGNAALSTIPSNRKYRTDCLFTAALWTRPEADYGTLVTTSPTRCGGRRLRPWAARPSCWSCR